MKKYELTNNVIEVNGMVLYRIRAVRDFGIVRNGELGGWVENEHNLSHSGFCWLFDDSAAFNNSKVFENAILYDNALVFENATVSGYARISGKSLVFENASISGSARVADNAYVYGNSRVLENAIVCDDARVYGNSEILSDTIINGNTHVHDICIFDDIEKRRLINEFLNNSNAPFDNIRKESVNDLELDLLNDALNNLLSSITTL